MRVKYSQMFIQTKTSPKLKMIGRSVWSSFKSKMPSLTRPSKYVNNTSVLSIKEVRGGQLGLKGLAKLDSYCSDTLTRARSNIIVPVTSVCTIQSSNLILYDNTLLTKWLSLKQKLRVELQDTRLYMR